MAIRHFLRHRREHLWSYIHSERSVELISYGSLLLILIMIALPIWKLLPVVQDNPFIPLHYNVYLGIDRFGPWYSVFVLPAIGVVFMLFNLMLASSFSGRGDGIFHKAKEEKLLEKFFLWMTLVIELVLLTGVVFILLLNI